MKMIVCLCPDVLFVEIFTCFTFLKLVTDLIFIKVNKLYLCCILFFLKWQPVKGSVPIITHGFCGVVHTIFANATLIVSIGVI